MAVSQVLVMLGNGPRDAHWRKVAGQIDGGGLEQGPPCLDGVQSARRFLKKHGRGDFIHHLERVVSGGSTARDRFDLNKNVCIVGLRATLPHTDSTRADLIPLRLTVHLASSSCRKRRVGT